MSKKPRTNLDYLMLGLFAPFAAVLLAVCYPVGFVVYWMGRGWARVPIIQDLFIEDDDGN